MTLYCRQAFKLVIGKAHGMVEPVGSLYTGMGPGLGYPLMSCAFFELLFPH